MILKEKESNQSNNPKLKAGIEAEIQMAFYLKRSFGKNDDYFIINDLRITHEGDVAQIDHLIITQYGLFIVESKSVYGKITVNKNKEWARTYNKTLNGMASPVLQAEAQGKVLKSLLEAHAEQLLGKLIGLQKRFGSCPCLIYVAISDTGVIERKSEVAELFKADQITQEIELKVKILRKNSGLLGALNTSEPAWSMKAEEAIRVAEFLITQHTPLIKNNTSSVITEIAKPPINADMIISIDSYKENDTCPKCKNGSLVKRKAKTEFLGCSNYPKCRFTDYK